MAPPAADDGALRPNQLLAFSLPYAPSSTVTAENQVAEAVVRRCRTGWSRRSACARCPRTTPAYRGRHRGGPADRDRAYHQGTVWPWLIGPFVDAAIATGDAVPGLLDGLDAHLGEWGLGSVSETADGDAPHAATGCPFQAWSVAELLRARRALRR